MPNGEPSRFIRSRADRSLTMRYPATASRARCLRNIPGRPRDDDAEFRLPVDLLRKGRQPRRRAGADDRAGSGLHEEVRILGLRHRGRLAGHALGDFGHFFQMVPIIGARAKQRARIKNRREQFRLCQQDAVTWLKPVGAASCSRRCAVSQLRSRPSTDDVSMSPAPRSNDAAGTMRSPTSTPALGEPASA